MAAGDPGTYSTTLRVTPLTDGTRHSIRMTNRATVTAGAEVILRTLALAGQGHIAAVG